MKYDIHTHTKFSDGYMDVRMMVRSAEAVGLDVIAITDHLFEGDKLGDGPATVDDMMEAVEETRGETDITVLAGVEGTILNLEGDISVSSDLARKLDLVIVDFSGWTRGVFKDAPLDPNDLIGNAVRCLINVCANPLVDIIAHPLNLGRCNPAIDLAEIPDSALSEIADAFLKNSVVFEVMSQMHFWFPNMPVSRITKEYIRIVRIFSDRGVNFSVSSDAHRSGTVGNLIWSEKVLKDAGVSPEQIIDPLELVKNRRMRRSSRLI